MTSCDASKLSLRLLNNWAKFSEKDWSTIPGHPKWGVYGTGYNAWGVQTTQKYLAAMAALGHYGKDESNIDAQWANDLALATLRYNLASHQSGDFYCTDNTQWGHTWISALGIERMMFGVHLLQPHFTDEDADNLQRVLISEANWLLTDYRRGSQISIQAGLWNSDGCNHPESNIWNGALLWRVAQMYPDHPHAGDWQERACDFLINGVSVPDDATNSQIIDGKPVSERFAGANFFPNYALDHHGYLNVGYMMICVSNAAILHFDSKTQGLLVPESLSHHQADLWQVLLPMIFNEGRMMRIGGDSRVRYAYCQDYQLPALLYAADHLGDAHALSLAKNQLRFIQDEAFANGDGSLYGNRLINLKQQNPYYYTRLESDRACVLAMFLAYHEKVNEPPQAKQTFEESVQGGWYEAQHGAAFHRSKTRFASFSWRAFGLAQGLCLPPQDGHLAEWENNLAGKVEFVNFSSSQHPARSSHRKLDQYHIDSFDDGFITCGSVIEGVDLTMEEGWRGTDSAKHQIAFVALPDNHTVIGMQHCRMGNRRGYMASIKGLQLNIPNDLYNNYHRSVQTAHGNINLNSPPDKELCLGMDGKWVNIEGKIGAVGFYGADAISVHRFPERRAGSVQSLFVEQFCFPCISEITQHEAGEMILDAGWAVLSSADKETTEQFYRKNQKVLLPNDHPDVRALRITALDNRQYIIVVNFGEEKVLLPAFDLCQSQLYDIASGKDVSETIHLDSGHAKVLLIK